MDSFRISELAKQVGRHTNTVDNWFKALEEKRLHYVNRVLGEKTYDGQDLQIACYIRDKRNEKWTLDGIFNVLPSQFELRPFPSDKTPAAAPEPVEIDAVLREIQGAAEQIAAAHVQELMEQYSDLAQHVLKPFDELEDKMRRVDDFLIQRRVVWELEDEAAKLWSTKPKSERMKSVGLFRKQENIDKRQRFVQNYVHKHLEDRIKRAYGLSPQE